MGLYVQSNFPEGNLGVIKMVLGVWFSMFSPPDRFIRVVYENRENRAEDSVCGFNFCWAKGRLSYKEQPRRN